MGFSFYNTVYRSTNTGGAFSIFIMFQTYIGLYKQLDRLTLIGH